MTDDRLTFYKYNIKGHTIFTHEVALPQNQIRILIPAGNVHAHKGNLFCSNGIFHFLEHMCFEKSKEWTDKIKYENFLALTGTQQNASTGPFLTEFSFKAPASQFSKVFSAYIDHITFPIFEIDDIKVQTNIIKNERDQYKYFPGNNHLSQYLMTNWINATYYPIEQLFGSDNDLNEITETQLKEVHELYYKKPLTIILGGPNTKKICDELQSMLPPALPKQHLEVKKEPVKWANNTYHEFQSPDVSTRIFYFGGFTSTESIDDYWRLELLINLLTHSEFGTFTKWLRKDKGWTYGIEPDLYIDNETILWWFGIPLNDDAPLETIQNELHSRIIETCKDADYIEQTIERMKLELCFDFETLNTRMDRAVHLFSTFKNIPSEKQYIDWLNDQNTESILSVYDQFMSPEVSGQCCAVPLKPNSLL